MVTMISTCANTKSKHGSDLNLHLCLEKQNVRIIMDTKWKLLNSNDKQRKYNLKETDFYQLFAYGHKYQSGAGDMVLIYPKHQEFEHPLSCFKLGDDMRLWVMPFDLEKRCLIYHDEFHFIFFNP